MSGFWLPFFFFFFFFSYLVEAGWRVEALEGEVTEFPSIKEKINLMEEEAAKPRMVTRLDWTFYRISDFVSLITVYLNFVR